MRVYIVYSYRAAQSYIVFRNFSLKREWKSNVRCDSVIWKNVEKREKERRRRRRQRSGPKEHMRRPENQRVSVSLSCFRSHRSFVDRQVVVGNEKISETSMALEWPRYCREPPDADLSAIQVRYAVGLSDIYPPSHFYSLRYSRYSVLNSILY